MDIRKIVRRTLWPCTKRSRKNYINHGFYCVWGLPCVLMPTKPEIFCRMYWWLAFNFSVLCFRFRIPVRYKSKSTWSEWKVFLDVSSLRREVIWYARIVVFSEINKIWYLFVTGKVIGWLSLISNILGIITLIGGIAFLSVNDCRKLKRLFETENSEINRNLYGGCPQTIFGLSFDCNQFNGQAYGHNSDSFAKFCSYGKGCKINSAFSKIFS